MKCAILLLIIFVLFGSVYFLKPTLYNPDSFYYFGVSCSPDSGLGIDKGILSNAFFGLLPCDIIVWKTISLIFLGLGIIGLVWFASSFDVNPFLVGLFGFLSPIFGLRFLGLEPETIGLVLVLFGLGFWFKHSRIKNAKIIAIGFFVLAIGFWEGAIVFLGFFAVMQPILFFALIPIALLNFEKVFYAFSFNGANETSFGLGLILLSYLIFGFYRIREQSFWLLALLLVALGFLNAKWIILVIPFLALNLAFVWNNFRFWRIDLKPIISMGLVLMIGVSLFALYFSYPTTAETDAIDFVLEKSDSVQNSWGLGNYIFGLGGTPSKLNGPPTPDFVCDDRPIVSLLDGYEDMLKDFKLEKCFDNVCVYVCE